ncbi:helix-turn-helix domain-containing protein [Nocardiopsis kunsanensis]|uniref:helix-turn-helix domain-containing protein n=1 Tax=Nocardiopsis kunsanensis TaxID=141693 RepID=UPI00034D5BFB|nr:helix-turn-helix domain-containing protein [Nocardiopsis kunsanensis]
MPPEQVRHARDLLSRPDNSVSSIARLLGVSRSTLYKHVPELSGRRTATSIPTSEETPVTVIPPRLADATTTLAEADQWCGSVLSGATTRILLLGPVRSGKTHHAYAMLKRILDAGYPPNGISVHESHDLVHGNDYKPRDFEVGTRVTFMDDLTDRVDNRVGVTTERVVEEPMIQSVMAAGRGALIDAVDRLVSRADASWIACASGKEVLATCLGGGIAEKLITSAHMVVRLPPRPLP